MSVHPPSLCPGSTSTSTSTPPPAYSPPPHPHVYLEPSDSTYGYPSFPSQSQRIDNHPISCTHGRYPSLDISNATPIIRKGTRDHPASIKGRYNVHPSSLEKSSNLFLNATNGSIDAHIVLLKKNPNLTVQPSPYYTLDLRVVTDRENTSHAKFPLSVRISALAPRPAFHLLVSAASSSLDGTNNSPLTLTLPPCFRGPIYIHSTSTNPALTYRLTLSPALRNLAHTREDSHTSKLLAISMLEHELFNLDSWTGDCVHVVVNSGSVSLQSLHEYERAQNRVAVVKYALYFIVGMTCQLLCCTPGISLF